MEDLLDFGEIVLVVSAGLTVAIAVRVVASRARLPTAALLLVVAAVAAELSSPLADMLSFEDVQKIATLALIAILFEGGMSIGTRRFRAAATPIAVLGVLGTFGTAALTAAGAHWLLGLDWTLAGLLGAALAPTDPAVTFSVLAGKEIEGRTGTILEGESGFNDPVGIALMLGMVELATSDQGSTAIVTEFLREMGVGLAVGVAGGIALNLVLSRVPLPERSLYPLVTLLGAGVVYGAGSVAHGSGFLAVFVAGIASGDLHYPHRNEVQRFHSAVADLGELAVFAALGLTVDLAFIGSEGLWWEGLVLAVLLGFLIRPLVVYPLLLGSGLQRNERLFVVWCGLKGAVPILLASLAVTGGTDDAAKIYGIVFVVVLFSVLVHGTAVPSVAARLRIPMHANDAG